MLYLSCYICGDFVVRGAIMINFSTIEDFSGILMIKERQNRLSHELHIYGNKDIGGMQ